MSTNTIYKILIALTKDSESERLKEGLSQSGAITLKINTAKDIYQLIDELKEEPVNLLIVSPIIISDVLIPLVKREVGQSDLKMISYCTTLMEDEMSKNFDGKILVTDSYSDAFSVVENVLAIEDEIEDTLTPREKDVVIAVVKGMTNKEIAEEFYLSPHTIITHRRNIARKLNIHSASGLTIYAIMNKLVSLNDIKDL